MLILFDHVTPAGIAHFLAGHMVTKAKERGWDGLGNGELLTAAEDAGFDVLVPLTRTFAISRTLKGAALPLWY
jgi:hypothetical protein